MSNPQCIITAITDIKPKTIFNAIAPFRLPQQLSRAVVAGSRHLIDSFGICIRNLCICHRKALTAQITFCRILSLTKQSNGRADYISMMLTVITLTAEISRQANGNQLTETADIIAPNVRYIILPFQILLPKRTELRSNFGLIGSRNRNNTRYCD